jgi:uncharacterized UPF0160 family protein
MIKKIITHNGQFHADEIFACALLQHVFGEIPIVRTRDLTIDDMNDPEIWVVDVGQVYNPELGLFDHHQSRELQASNMLVLSHLNNISLIEDDLYSRLRNEFKSISIIDCTGYDEYEGFQLTSLIKSFNSLDNGFQVALYLAKSFIMARSIDCLKAHESRELFDNGTILHDRVRVCDKFPLFWKSYAECDFLVSMDQNGKWCLHSRDSKEFPILPTGKEKFLHTGKFIAVYASKEDAVEAASKQAVLHYD